MKDACDDRKEQISRLLSNDLTSATRNELEQHLNKCASCTEYLRALQEDDRLFAAYAEHMTSTVARIENGILEHLDFAPSAKPVRTIPILETMKKIFLPHKSGTKRLIYATAIMVAVVIFGLTGLLPFFSNQHSGKTAWWLGPQASWGQEIMTALNKVKAVTCHERLITVLKDGSRHESSTTFMLSTSHDSYMRVIFDKDKLREIQWYTPDGGDMIQTSVRFDTATYTVQRHQGSFGCEDPVERMSFYVGLIDKADRLFGPETIDGTQCVGFEISASKYGDNPSNWLNRIWFDVETKLPVRIEEEIPATDGEIKATIWIQDQFDWNASFMTDFFKPEIPEGYTHAHPDDLRSDQQSTVGGTGLLIANDREDNSLTVVSVLPESPAFRAGIRKGDKIIELDGKSAKEIDIEQAIELLRGEPGTKVAIKILRPADQSILEYNIIREHLQTPRTTEEPHDAE